MGTQTLWKKILIVILTVFLLLNTTSVFLAKVCNASDIANPAVKAKQSKEYSPNTAWELGYSGKGVSIAIMDTGVDNGHPSLINKWVAGVDFILPNTPLTPRDGTYDPDDTNGHGTTVSGIAMGTGEPERKYQGIAVDAKLVEVKIGTKLGIGPGEIPYLQDIYDSALKGIEWVVEHREEKWKGAPEDYYGIDVLSLSWGIYPEGEDASWGSNGSDKYSMALNKLVDSGVIAVVAAGNEGPGNEGLYYMGAASKVITVAATNDRNTINRTDDVIAGYSSRGPRKDNGDGYPYDELKPDIAAPGSDITQAEYDPMGDGSGNGYGPRGSGTSYATPLVAGIVALILEANPDLTPEAVKEILRFTAERRGNATFPDIDPFWNKEYGWGIVDAYKAVRVAEKTDVNDTDIELQCFITNITKKSDDKLEILGTAWARRGKAEKVEIKIDNGQWFQVTPRGNLTAPWKVWAVELDTSQLSPGNHTIEARAVSGGKYSLVDSTTFTPIEKVGLEDLKNILIISISILIVSTAVLITFTNLGRNARPFKGGMDKLPNLQTLPQQSLYERTDFLQKSVVFGNAHIFRRVWFKKLKKKKLS